jgi:hypothetical protein
MRIGWCIAGLVLAAWAARGRADDPPPVPPSGKFGAGLPTPPNAGGVGRPAPNANVSRLPECDSDCGPRFPSPWPTREDFAWIFEPAEGPHIGVGQPLVGASWLYRPFSIGTFFGPVTGNELAGTVEVDAALLMGFRFGWDVEAFWGLEARLAFADPKLNDASTGRDYDEGDFVLWDINVLCYPWGESRLRPYASIGLGMAKFSFTDIDTQPYRDDVVSLPLAIGLKYRCTPWLAVRFDLTDTISIAGDTTGTLNSFSFTFGGEYRFGGPRTFYWPWQTGGW